MPKLPGRLLHRRFLVLRYLSYFISLAAIFLGACSAGRRGQVSRQLEQTLTDSPVFSRHFTGFALYDPERSEMIYARNADKYFTPASNTKLFTFYTCLNVLGDSIPALRYVIDSDSLIFWGTGDPSFLHPTLKSTKVYEFLAARRENLLYAYGTYAGERFGPGWSWDDYNDYYSSEKAELPMYGNVVRFKVALPEITAYPRYFGSLLLPDNTRGPQGPLIRRSEFTNQFHWQTGRMVPTHTVDIPYRYTPELVRALLTDTLHRAVDIAQRGLPTGSQVLYSVPADSVYKVMLQESDNFMAEQLLLVCSSLVSDTLSTEQMIRYATERFLADLPDKPTWVDGSGLSRYNLFTPRSIVSLLVKIREKVPRERLFALLPAGGQSGTIKDWYTGAPAYVFAKTGTLSNTHCLSGYLVTRTGRTLVFSFMHNNYVMPTNEIRKEMERVLRQIHEQY